MEKNKILTKRYIARICLEAKTPLKLGSGEQGTNVDQLIATDVNGLPTIPGTSLMGVLRRCFNDRESVNELFGCSGNQNEEGSGSRVMISNAYLVNEDGNVLCGLLNMDSLDTIFLKTFRNLPVRQHVRITHKGASDNENHGKFDEQVVFKGTRFSFEIELHGSSNDEKSWNNILSTFNSPSFRLGSGTRKGFGEMGVEKIQQRVFNLEIAEDLKAYQEKGISFNQSLGEQIEVKASNSNDLVHYALEITPEDFYLFSSGAANGEIDMNAMKECVLTWNENLKAQFSDEKILIPASSVKGAIAHRTAFYYNKLKGIGAENLSPEELGQHTGENNKAVKDLFGYALNSKLANEGQAGNVILSDVYQELSRTKVLNHVSIDRFTGGARQGALFNEEVIEGGRFTLNLYVDTNKISNKESIEALESALKDITNGMLPLGGGVMRGHGAFHGTLTKNGEKL